MYLCFKHFSEFVFIFFAVLFLCCALSFVWTRSHTWSRCFVSLPLTLWMEMPRRLGSSPGPVDPVTPCCVDPVYLYSSMNPRHLLAVTDNLAGKF